jgi:hypothetical protein
MKYLILIVFLVLVACSNKEDVFLSKSNVTVVADVQDHSPIYIFFRTYGKDTVAEVNRKNSIISTNWILNIDKRLPLRLVIPEVVKLQQKKHIEKTHKNEKAENYYSYADTITKQLAFIPFTNVFYKMDTPQKMIPFLRFEKNDVMTFNNQLIFSKELIEVLNNASYKHKVVFGYDKNMTFGEYIRKKVFLNSLNRAKNEKVLKDNSEFIY